MSRGPVAEISLSSIAHNLHHIRRIVNNRPVIAVVKAAAYGHGAVDVSRRLIQEGVLHLAVAYTGEAKELRESGIDVPILVLFDNGDIRDYFDYQLTPVVYSMNTASWLSREAEKRNDVIRVHVKVDTGMGRLGLTGERALDDLMRISHMPGIEVAGLLSHFSEADLADHSYAISQLREFRGIQEAFTRQSRRRIVSHIANSAAVLSLEDAHLDAVRPGLMLYGYSPFGDSHVRSGNSLRIEEGLLPAMRVRTRILCIRSVPTGTPISYGRTFVTKRQSRIGVIAIGYADGYFRALSNNSEVLVRGARAPVVGRVCMDLTMVDLTGNPSAEEGDEVVVLGSQGPESITAYELASRANSISYEVLTSLGSRSGRVHVEAH